MCNSSRLLTTCAALALLAAAPAFAADYDPPIYIEEAPEYVPVEIGSGWYLRGDVGYSFQRSYNDSSLRIDNSIFDGGLVSFDPIVPLTVFSASENTLPVSGSIGVGYHINDYLRVDANIGMLFDDRYKASGFLGDRLSYLDRPAADFGCQGTLTSTETTTVTRVDAEGNTISTDRSVGMDSSLAREGCGVEGTLRNSAYNGMVNGYVDLGTIAGFTPYVGAGVGLMYTRSKLTVQAFCEAEELSELGPTRESPDGRTRTQTQIDRTFLCNGQNAVTDAGVTYTPVDFRHSEYNFMYGLTAGVAYQITDNAKLDLGYHYTSAPNLAYYKLTENGVEQGKGYDQHQIKVGLRYDLW